MGTGQSKQPEGGDIAIIPLSNDPVVIAACLVSEYYGD